MWQKLRSAAAGVFQRGIHALKRLWGRVTESKIKLSYFDEMLAVELQAVNERRKQIALKMHWPNPPIRKLEPEEAHVDGRTRPASPPLPTPIERPAMTVNPNRPDPTRAHPQPIPCTAVGLALSGGGIRSAAFCLGALQALDFRDVIVRTDYISTVSGGGYIGASLTAAMSNNGGQFPFGGDADIRDNDAVGHIRNYSNYLMPRARSGLRNLLDAASIILRGLLANALIVLTFQLAAALLTAWAYPRWDDLQRGSFALRIVTAPPEWLRQLLGKLWSKLVPDWLAGPVSLIGSWLGSHLGAAASWIGGLLASWMPSQLVALYRFITSFADYPFFLTGLLAGALGAILLYWALRRSLSDADANDVNSSILRLARTVLGLTALSALLDLQPLFISWLGLLYESHFKITALATSPIVGAAVAVAVFASRISVFLRTTELSAHRTVRFKRILAQIMLIASGLVLPLVVLLIYWQIAAWLIEQSPIPGLLSVADARFYGPILLGLLIPVMWAFEANAYSLHQFYKDRLSKAFLFRPDFSGRADPPELRKFKLSSIKSGNSPYHIINAALNVQGSTEANRRGRNADFFTFTRDFVGCDLTHFAVTRVRTTTNDMETVDHRLDLGSAMAISGAALSANMGSSTVRWLSPTLALLNIRLGYWLRNPLDLARQKKFVRPVETIYRIIGKFYLLLEMFNLLDENRSFIYLTDGGHIENLGIYQLLKRGCRLVIAIDAEADPEISCASLLKLERYARIDLGIRIILPWEQIRMRNRKVDELVDPGTPEEPSRQRGPHCALGRILYEDGSLGMLLYFKSSLSGDEKDYLLDYKKRNPDFPHETTGDQFFTEEQFEVYRALGYHVIDGYFSDADDISWLKGGHGAWADVTLAKAEVRRALRVAESAADAAADMALVQQ